MTTRETFLAAMAVLFAAFDKPLTDLATEAYWLALQSLTPDEIQGATARALARCKFCPVPSELLTLAGKNQDAEVAEAWGAVRRAIDKHDYMVRTIDFGPRVNAVIRNLGGWDTLCDAKLTELDNPGWLRKRFEEVYRAMAYKPEHDLLGEPLESRQTRGWLSGAKDVRVQIGPRSAPQLQVQAVGGAGEVVAELAKAKSGAG
jgi:hypothetical protein